MAQREIEVILMRQLASCLAMPVFIVDAQGSLIFFNEPAEALLGRRFEESGEMPADELTTLFSPADGSGSLSFAEIPVARALAESRPVCGRFAITGLDNVRRTVDVSAFPLLGQGARKLGAVALFQESAAR